MQYSHHSALTSTDRFSSQLGALRLVRETQLSRREQTLIIDLE